MELKPKDAPQVELDEVERGQEVPLFPKDSRQKVRPALALQRQLSCSGERSIAPDIPCDAFVLNVWALW